MESPETEVKQINQPKKKEMKHLSKLMDSPTKRTEQFNVLLSKVEKSMVEEMAEFYELTPPNFMRSAIPALYKLMEVERKEKAKAMELNLKIDEQ